MGKIACLPALAKLSSRYARMSSKNRSANAKCSMPWSSAPAIIKAIRLSYTSFGHCGGIHTLITGRPMASACRSSSSSRTPDMLTRSYPSVNVVRSARTSKPGSRRSVHNPNAESFPALHENTTGVDTPAIVTSGAMTCEVALLAGPVFGASRYARPSASRSVAFAPLRHSPGHAKRNSPLSQAIEFGRDSSAYLGHLAGRWPRLVYPLDHLDPVPSNTLSKANAS